MSGTVRVLHVLDYLSPCSGVASFVMNYFRFLKERGILFDIIASGEPDSALSEKVRRWGGTVYNAPPLKIAKLPKYAGFIAQVLDKRGYAIVHGHVPYLAPLYLGVAKARGVPNRIIHSHSTAASGKRLSAARNRIVKPLIPLAANRYLACSRQAGRFLFGSASDVTVIPNAIDALENSFSQEKRERIRRELNLGDRLALGHIGRLSPEKNQAFLFDVLIHIRATGRDCVLLLCGDGPQREVLEKAARDRGIWESIVFLGARGDVGDLLSGFDAFLLPSFFEGFTISGLEAQASGLPCFFSDTIAPESSVTDKVSFLPLNEPGLWANAILNTPRRPRGSGDFGESLYNITHASRFLGEYYMCL